MAETGDVSSARSWGSLFVALGIFSFLMLLAFPGVAWIGSQWYGPASFYAAMIAGGACWLGGLAAIAVAGMFSGPQAVNGVLLGMLFRGGPALGLLALSSGTENRWAAAGLPGLLVVYYLLSLGIETVLSIRQLQNQQQKIVVKAS